MMQIPKFDLYPYWELFKRRKWWIIAPFLIVVMAGTSYMYTTPKTYRSSSLILIEGQSIPESYVDSTISGNIKSRLHTITQQLNSRTNLQRIIKRYDLYRSEDYESSKRTFALFVSLIHKLPFVSEGEASLNTNKQDDPTYIKVETLREKIDVNLQGKNNRGIEIAFLWEDPQVAAQVANAITSQFIEQNLKIREETAVKTTEFLSLEVAQLRNKLAKKEKVLEDFRMKNLGKLPKQLETNLNLLNQKKDELNNLEKKLDTAKQKEMMLSEQIESGLNIGEKKLEEQISELQGKLEGMKIKYTEKHPDLIAFKRRIAQKRSELKKLEDEKSQKGSQNFYNEDRTTYTYGQDTLLGQLAETREKIDGYVEQIDQVKTQLANYKQRIEDTPKIDLKLKDLQRNYETVKRRYENLLAKKLDAQMAEELEKRQQGEQFKVVDSAIPPVTPFKPDMRKLGLMTFLLGLGFGGGLAYLRESLDPAFFSPEDAESYLGRKIIVTLPWENSKE